MWSSLRDKKVLIPMRYAVLALISMVGAILIMNSANLSVTLVAMTTHMRPVVSNSSFSPDGCPDNSHNNDDSDTTNSTADVIDGEFDWNQSQQGLILSASACGYIVFQVVSGRLAEMWGGKWLFAFGIVIAGLINLLTPAIARWNLIALIVSRVILGASQSVDLPAGYLLITRWFPEHEFGRALAIISAGIQFGSIITMLLSGYLSSTEFLGGWPAVFYVSGALAGVSLLLWIIFMTSEPRDNRFIPIAELEYIETGQSFRQQNEKDSGRVKRNAPWLRIITSPAVLAMIVVKFSSSWTASLLIGKIPVYLQSVLHYPIAQNGYTMALMILGLTVSMSVGGLVSDLIIKRQLASKTAVRKVFELIALGGSSVSLVMITLVGCDRNAVVGLLVLAMLLYGQVSGGDIPVIADMTSNFPATIIAMANSLATVASIIVPLVVGAMIGSDAGSRALWARVVYVTIAVNVVGYVVFLVWGEACLQDWDRESADQKSKHDKPAEHNKKDLFTITRL